MFEPSDICITYCMPWLHMSKHEEIIRWRVQVLFRGYWTQKGLFPFPISSCTEAHIEDTVVLWHVQSWHAIRDANITGFEHYLQACSGDWCVQLRKTTKSNLEWPPVELSNGELGRWLQPTDTLNWGTFIWPYFIISIAKPSWHIAYSLSLSPKTAATFDWEHIISDSCRQGWWFLYE